VDDADLNSLTSKLFKITQGMSQKEIEEALNTFIFMRSHDILQEKKGKIEYVTDADWNDLVYKLFEITQ